MNYEITAAPVWRTARTEFVVAMRKYEFRLKVVVWKVAQIEFLIDVEKSMMEMETESTGGTVGTGGVKDKKDTVGILVTLQ